MYKPKYQMLMLHYIDGKTKAEYPMPKKFFVSRRYMAGHMAEDKILLMTPSLWNLLLDSFLYTVVFVWYWPLMHHAVRLGLIKTREGEYMLWSNFNPRFWTWGDYCDLPAKTEAEIKAEDETRRKTIEELRRLLK